LEESLDEDNKSRYVFAVSAPYIEKEAKIESTLIDTSLIDESCVESFVSKYIKQRFDSGKLEIFDANDNEINLEQLLDILQQIVAYAPKNSHENDSVEASTSNENTGTIA
jgi:hypothetical protein